jgi:hypothetical protein
VKARKHYDGLNTSSVIGFIEALPADSLLEFKVIPEEKLAIVGGENTLLGSGGSHISVRVDPGFQSKPGQPGPVFVCPCFASNALHSYNLERICHLTAGNGWLALACCMARTPGVFICHTEAHAKALRRHVIQQLFRMKQSADDGVYDPDLITLLESLPKDDEAAQTTPLRTAKKAGREKTAPLKTAKGDVSTASPSKTPHHLKKRPGASKKKEKKGASKKRKGADDGSDDGAGSESWPSSSEAEDAD